MRLRRLVVYSVDLEIDSRCAELQALLCIRHHRTCDMTTIFKSLLCLPLLLWFSACEQHDWEETKVLYEKHGSHGSHEGHGEHGEHGDSHGSHSEEGHAAEKSHGEHADVEHAAEAEGEKGKKAKVLPE
jgi:hypothetical protein